MAKRQGAAIAGTSIKGRVLATQKGETILETRIGRVRVNSRRIVTTTLPEEDSGRVLVEKRRGKFDEVLDLHRMSPEEAEEKVDRFIDEAVMRSAERVRIIHGKGSGRLKAIVHARLKDHPAVARFDLAEIYEGSYGATVATLK